MEERVITNTDYFPHLAVLADENGEISGDLAKGKPLELFLAQRFKLSKPTVLALLNAWEKEGKIEMERDAFGHISRIRILFQRFFSKQRWNKILVLIDWSNLVINLPPNKPILTAAWDRIQQQISRELEGEIIGVFIFVPPHLTSTEAETFYKEGFIIVYCPKIKTKDRVEKDTTDETMIELGRKLISQIPDLTHLCLGSGDKDFGPLAREAIRKGLKILVVAGDLRSLSSELIQLADGKPGGGKMVFILSPTE